MDPLLVLKERDEKIYNMIKEIEDFAMQDGAIPLKYKLLTVFAIDASHGTINGVKSLYNACKAIGVTDEEINEMIKLATYVSGVSCSYVVADALNQLK